MMYLGVENYPLHHSYSENGNRVFKAMNGVNARSFAPSLATGDVLSISHGDIQIGLAFADGLTQAEELQNQENAEAADDQRGEQPEEQEDEPEPDKQSSTEPEQAGPQEVDQADTAQPQTSPDGQAAVQNEESETASDTESDQDVEEPDVSQPPVVIDKTTDGISDTAEMAADLKAEDEMPIQSADEPGQESSEVTEAAPAEQGDDGTLDETTEDPETPEKAQTDTEATDVTERKPAPVSVFNTEAEARILQPEVLTVSSDTGIDNTVFSEDAVGESDLSTDADTESWDINNPIPAKLSSQVVYPDVYPGIDVQYELFGYNIKESIILKEPKPNKSSDAEVEK